jgi:hypothetical protein
MSSAVCFILTMAIDLELELTHYAEAGNFPVKLDA